VMLRSSP